MPQTSFQIKSSSTALREEFVPFLRCFLQTHIFAMNQNVDGCHEIAFQSFHHRFGMRPRGDRVILLRTPSVAAECAHNHDRKPAPAPADHQNVRGAPPRLLTHVTDDAAHGGTFKLAAKPGWCTSPRNRIFITRRRRTPTCGRRPILL